MKPLGFVEPRWRVSRFARRLATVGLLAAAIAGMFGRAELIVIAAPCLVALVLTFRTPRVEQLDVEAHIDEPRCFEGEPIEVRVRVSSSAVLGEIALSLDVPETFDVEPPIRRTSFRTMSHEAVWVLRPRRWGRWSVGPVHIEARTATFGHQGTAKISVGHLTVFPPPSRARDVAVPPALLARVGSHVARRVGAGVEFAGTRPYAPGDLARRINWPVSTRRRALYVNEFAAERAADVIAVVDTTVDVGPFPTSSLDLGVRGAAAVVQAYLRYADRVGLVSLGGRLRWLAPDAGTRQYFRIVETLLAARLDESVIDPDIAHLPRQALPPGALVFFFSPLLDPRAMEAIRDLRERGHAVVVVDVLTVEPTGKGPADDLGLRVWRLEREVLLHGLRALGVTLLKWDEESGVALDRVRLEPLIRVGR